MTIAPDSLAVGLRGDNPSLTLTDLEDSSDPDDNVSRLLRLLELRCGEDEGESSMYGRMSWCRRCSSARSAL